MIFRDPRLPTVFLLTSILSAALVPAGSAAPGEFLGETTVPIGASLGVSIAFDGDIFYYTNHGDTSIHRYTLACAGAACTATSLASLTATYQGYALRLDAIAYDAGRNVLWGAGNGDSWVYRVDRATGVAQRQFQAGACTLYSLVDGIAYDGESDTIWFSSDGSDSACEFSMEGILLRSVNIDSMGLPSYCYNSGIAVGGSDLYLGSNGCGQIVRVDKATFENKGVFASPGGRDEDMECDPVTFAPKSVIWSKDAYNNRVTAFEIAQGTCGLGGFASGEARAFASSVVVQGGGDNVTQTAGIRIDPVSGEASLGGVNVPVSVPGANESRSVSGPGATASANPLSSASARSVAGEDHADSDASAVAPVAISGLVYASQAFNTAQTSVLATSTTFAGEAEARSTLADVVVPGLLTASSVEAWATAALPGSSYVMDGVVKELSVRGAPPVTVEGVPTRIPFEGGYVALFEPTVRGDGVELTEGSGAAMRVHFDNVSGSALDLHIGVARAGASRALPLETPVEEGIAAQAPVDTGDILAVVDLVTMTVQPYLDAAEDAAAAASATANATREQVERFVGDTLSGLPPIPGLTLGTAYGEGFENGLGGWSGDGYGRDWALVSGIAHSGNYSIEATANYGWRLMATPVIGLEAGSYTLRWWEDITRANSSDQLALLMRTNQTGWTVVDDARVSTTGWEEASYRFTLDDPKDVLFGFYVDTWGAPARWGVDDVAVERTLAVEAPDVNDPTRMPLDPTGPIPIGNFGVGGISRIRQTYEYDYGGGCCTESYSSGSDQVVVQGVGSVYNSWYMNEWDHDHGSWQHGSSYGQQAVGASTIAGNAVVFRAWGSDYSEDTGYSYLYDASAVGTVACAPGACLVGFAGAGEQTGFGHFVVVGTNVGAVALAADESEPSATLYVNALVLGYREVPLIP